MLPFDRPARQKFQRRRSGMPPSPTKPIKPGTNTGPIGRPSELSISGPITRPRPGGVFPMPGPVDPAPDFERVRADLAGAGPGPGPAAPPWRPPALDDFDPSTIKQPQPDDGREPPVFAPDDLASKARDAGVIDRDRLPVFPMPKDPSSLRRLY